MAGPKSAFSWWALHPAGGRGTATTAGLAVATMTVLSLLFCLAPDPAVGAVQPSSPVPTRWLAQDSAGTVWAAVGGYSARQAGWQPGIYRWSGGAFRLAAAAKTSFEPTGIWPLGGGIVVADSIPSDGYTSLWWYRHGRKTVLAELGQGCLQLQQVVASRGVVYAVCLHARWAAPSAGAPTRPLTVSLHLYRITGGHSPALILRLGTADMFPFPLRAGETAPVLPLHAARAPHGAIWLWAGVPARAWREQILRGVVILNGSRVTRLATLPGLPDAPLSAVGPWDAEHLAAAMAGGGGVYLIAADSRRARPLALPAGGDFRWVQKIFAANGNHYLVVSTPGRQLRLTPGHRLRDAVWRARGGHWDEAIAGMDDASRPALAARRPFLAAPDGVWMGTMASGLWWIPRQGMPRLLDWRAGFPLPGVSRLFHLPGDRILAFSNRQRRAAVWSPHELLRPQPPPRVLNGLRVVNPRLLFAPDAAGRVWGLDAANDGALEEWTGRSWRRIALPLQIQPRAVSGLGADQRGRIWLFPDCWLGRPVAAYTPATNHWAVYANYRTALMTLPAPLRMLYPAQDRMTPIYGPHGQIVYQGDCFGINYFDGRRWRLWNRAEWPGPPSAFLGSRPFFDSTGHLALDIRHSTWAWRAPAGWSLAAYQPQPVQPATPSPAAAQNARGGCPSSPPAVSLTTGPWGRQWWTTKRGALYVGWAAATSGAGASAAPSCRLVLAADRRQPFIDGRRLQAAFPDRWGDVFLQTIAAGIGKYVVLLPPKPPPQIHVHLAANAPAEMRVQLSSSRPRGAWFIWRLDGGPWSRPSRAAVVILRHLPGGRHTIAVMAFDRQLEAAMWPAQLAFTVSAPPPHQIPALLADLAAAQTNAQRQAIVRQLLRFPPSELRPALQAAMAHATPAARWWLRAAAQQLGHPPP